METTTTLDPTETRNLHTEWTDEKHSLYLKGMEATFVNQLYASADSIGLHARKESSLDLKSSRQMNSNTSTIFRQFKVFQGGCWKKVCNGKADLQLNREDDSRYPQENPWIKHFRPRRGHQAVADPALEETAESVDCRGRSREEKAAFSFKLATRSEQFHPDHGHSRVRDLEDCDNEVSDQNFVGEDIEVKKTTPKRMKRPLADYSNTDQEGSSS